MTGYINIVKQGEHSFITDMGQFEELPNVYIDLLLDGKVIATIDNPEMFELEAGFNYRVITNNDNPQRILVYLDGKVE